MYYYFKFQPYPALRALWIHISILNEFSLANVQYPKCAYDKVMPLVLWTTIIKYYQEPTEQ